MNDKNKKIVTVLSIFTIIFTLMGGTLAYWTWTSDVRTGVAFTIDKDFSCSADGGGNITAANISLEPTTCSNTSSAIKREIKVTPDLNKNGIEISMDLWLDINYIGSGLSNSYNFKYVLTTSSESCDKGTIISSGNFNGKKDGDKVVIMEKNYTADANETYYLYLWLDERETSSSTMNQTFDFSLGGVCSNHLGQPEAPVLDPGMIPVTIADNGDVTVVSETDPNWYNYENKQWANIVLVEEDGAGETDSHTREYYQNPANVGQEVTQEDILAYYVWVPRYKYRIPHKMCFELTNPTMENHPECYAPYKFENNKQREYFENWMLENHIGFGSDEEYMNFISRKFEDMYSTGGCITLNQPYCLIDMVNLYNDEGAFNPDTGEPDPTREANLVPSNFNGNAAVESNALSIDIVFESADEVMKLGNATTEYRTHPSFWWDDDSDGNIDSNETLSGIWVGKFNSNPEKDSDCANIELEQLNQNFEEYLNWCNNSTQNPTVLPDVANLSFQNVSNQFYTSRNISKENNIYGLNNKTINAHMMKNSEYGAITYLAVSKYGIGMNIFNLEGDEYEYGTPLSLSSNTTGNMSGIFNFFIFKRVNVMAVGSTDMECNDYEGECSGFDNLPKTKYYDSYEGDDYKLAGYYGFFPGAACTIEDCAGHALYEYGSSPGFVPEYSPWIVRFSNYALEAFSSSGKFDKDFDSLETWRSVLVPGFGD